MDINIDGKDINKSFNESDKILKETVKGNKAKIFVSCEDAAQRGGIVPTPGAPVSIKLTDDSVASCEYETVMGIATPACPAGCRTCQPLRSRSP